MWLCFTGINRRQMVALRVQESQFLGILQEVFPVPCDGSHFLVGYGSGCCFVLTAGGSSSAS